MHGIINNKNDNSIHNKNVCFKIINKSKYLYNIYFKINVFINLVLGVNHHTRLPVFPAITIKMLLEI